MTLYLSIFRQGQTTFQSILAGIGNIYENNLFMAHYFEFLELKPQMQVAAPRQKLPVSLIRGIEFRGVGFRYPESDEWVLRGIDLKIPPGEKIALVGHNGAGKTTLIKLLSRLYDPTEGAILIDGIDIRELDPIELRQKIGVIFQDFRPLSSAGQRKHRLRPDRSGRPHGQDRRIRPQERRRRDDRRFTRRLSDLLGRWFHGGHELSLGQWQRVALARAFMRDAEILVLDEPTASLDARTEYEIFQHFKELTAGKMAILISHRFSTVRMADRIVVIQGGQIVEIGSHEELLRMEGTYAQLFSMQAEGYR